MVRTLARPLDRLLHGRFMGSLLSHRTGPRNTVQEIRRNRSPGRSNSVGSSSIFVDGYISVAAHDFLNLFPQSLEVATLRLPISRLRDPGGLATDCRRVPLVSLHF